jgi:phosphatidylserine synthase
LLIIFAGLVLFSFSGDMSEASFILYILILIIVAPFNMLHWIEFQKAKRSNSISGFDKSLMIFSILPYVLLSLRVVYAILGGIYGVIFL